MNTMQTLILTAFLVTGAACSKQDATAAKDQASSSEKPAMEKPMAAMPSATDVKPTVMLPNEIKVDDTTTAIEQNDSGKKVLFWYDPMLPERHFSKSGQSPFMEMKLAPQYAVEADKGDKP